MSEHGTENQFKTTPEMKDIGLYYKSEKKVTYLCYFYKTSTGNFIPKKEHRNIKGIYYIKHKGSNYTRKNLVEHIYLKAPLKKGISKKYAHRKRKAKLSLFDRLVNWFRSTI